MQTTRAAAIMLVCVLTLLSLQHAGAVPSIRVQLGIDTFEKPW